MKEKIKKRQFNWFQRLCGYSMVFENDFEKIKGGLLYRTTTATLLAHLIDYEGVDARLYKTPKGHFFVHGAEHTGNYFSSNFIDPISEEKALRFFIEIERKEKRNCCGTREEFFDKDIEEA